MGEGNNWHSSWLSSYWRHWLRVLIPQGNMQIWDSGLLDLICGCIRGLGTGPQRKLLVFLLRHIHRDYNCYTLETTLGDECGSQSTYSTCSCHSYRSVGWSWELIGRSLSLNSDWNWTKPRVSMWPNQIEQIMEMKSRDLGRTVLAARIWRIILLRNCEAAESWLSHQGFTLPGCVHVHVRVRVGVCVMWDEGRGHRGSNTSAHHHI